MSDHRMISTRITNSARFLQMPLESQILYFHLLVRADDDGIVEAYPILSLLKTPADCVKILFAKDFIRPLNDDQVVVITKWTEHNTIRPDRKKNSIYLDLLLELYPDIEIVEPKPRSDVFDNSKRVNGPSTDGLSKGKLSKVNTPASLSAPQEIKKMNNYNENSSSDSYEKVVDIDTGEIPATPKPKTAESYGKMLAWATERTGKKFMFITKQFKAFKAMKAAGISMAEAKGRWIEMENDPFWKDKGFDWMSVATSFDKKR